MSVDPRAAPAVVLQQVVAAARRKVQPTSVIYWELDDVEHAYHADRRRAPLGRRAANAA